MRYVYYIPKELSQFIYRVDIDGNVELTQHNDSGTSLRWAQCTWRWKIVETNWVNCLKMEEEEFALYL